MGWIVRAWRGEEHISKVLFIYVVLVPAAVKVGLSILSTIGPTHVKVPFIGIGVAIVWCVYCIWVMIVSWRCAFTGGKLCGYIVRSIIIILMLVLLKVFLMLYTHKKFSQTANVLPSMPLVQSSYYRPAKIQASV